MASTFTIVLILLLITAVVIFYLYSQQQSVIVTGTGTKTQTGTGTSIATGTGITATSSSTTTGTSTGTRTSTSTTAGTATGTRTSTGTSASVYPRYFTGSTAQFNVCCVKLLDSNLNFRLNWYDGENLLGPQDKQFIGSMLTASAFDNDCTYVITLSSATPSSTQKITVTPTCNAARAGF
jgi:hypothetical protein